MLDHGAQPFEPAEVEDAVFQAHAEPEAAALRLTVTDLAQQECLLAIERKIDPDGFARGDGSGSIDLEAPRGKIRNCGIDGCRTRGKLLEHGEPDGLIHRETVFAAPFHQ